MPEDITVTGKKAYFNEDSSFFRDVYIYGNIISSGIVTSITAGSGISIDKSTGNVTITATGGGGGGDSLWYYTTVGIHTLSNVGIGTTNPTSKLTVRGNGSFTGILTALSFIKSGGTSSQFLKADGSVDSNVYLTSYNETDTLNSVTTRGNTTSNSITVGNATASSFIKSGGTSSQFLKADGTVDSNVYLSSAGSGSNLTGIVTYITAGSGISVNQSTGNVTISATGAGLVSSQWVTTNAGIHTLSNVGVGTTNPASKLQVDGTIIISGNDRTLDFISAVENVDKVSGIRFYESFAGYTEDARMGIDYNADDSLPSSGQLEFKGFNLSTNKYEIISVINRSGNIGIGTSRPTSRLTVEGNSFFTGIVTAAFFVGDGSGLTNVGGGVVRPTNGLMYPRRDC